MNATQDVVKRASGTNELAGLLPPVDVIEDEAGITVTADLPGVTRENLAIRLDGDTLVIEAPITLGESKNLEGVYAEIRAGQYRRSFTLSRELDTAKIEAAIKDGILKLHVPKLEHARPRRIEVKAG